MGGMKARYDCIKAFSETDFTEDLKKFDVPTLILHGDDDQIVPIVAAAPLSAKLVKNATLKVYPGFPHGMPTTQADQINADSAGLHPAAQAGGGLGKGESLACYTRVAPGPRHCRRRPGAYSSLTSCCCTFFQEPFPCNVL